MATEINTKLDKPVIAILKKGLKPGEKVQAMIDAGVPRNQISLYMWRLEHVADAVAASTEAATGPRRSRSASRARPSRQRPDGAVLPRPRRQRPRRQRRVGAEPRSRPRLPRARRRRQVGAARARRPSRVPRTPSSRGGRDCPEDRRPISTREAAGGSSDLGRCTADE
jgi:hypothetical protein